MKLELKAIGYWSLLKVSFIVNLIAGFIIGIFVAIFMGLIFSFVARMGGMSGMPLMQEEMPSFGLLLILYPFFLGFGGAVFNTLFFLIAAFIYNQAAKWVGGLELEFAQVPVAPQPVYAPPYYPPPPQTPPPPPPPVQPLPPDVTPPEQPGP